MRKSNNVKSTTNSNVFGVISSMKGEMVDVKVGDETVEVKKTELVKISKNELTELQNCVKEVVKEETVEVKVKKITKKMKCQQIYVEMSFISEKFRRQLTLQRFLDEVGLSLKGGSTYYQNFKSQLKGWEIN